MELFVLKSKILLLTTKIIVSKTKFCFHPCRKQRSITHIAVKIVTRTFFKICFKNKILFVNMQIKTVCKQNKVSRNKFLKILLKNLSAVF